MTRVLKSFTAAILALLLFGCERADQQPAPEATRPADSAPAASQVRSEPADDPPPVDTSAAAMAHKTDTLERALTERQQLRAQRLDSQGWWTDEELSTYLRLDAEQAAALLQARQALIDARLRARAELLGQRGSEQSVDELERLERSEGLRQDSDAIRMHLHEAQLAWEKAVGEILSEEQLARLIDRQPTALSGRPL